MRWLVACFVTLAVVTAQEEELFELNIIHHNDFHAHFEEINPSGTVCNAGEECIGGLARMYTAIMKDLEDEPESWFKGNFEEINPSGTVCNAGEECIGGLARMYTAIMEALENEPDSLVLDGGDTFQGTIWYNFLRWNVTQHFMNLIPHTAHVLGNHEFDHGVIGLVPYLEALKAPMLGANVNTTFEPEMTPYINNHIVVTVRGRRIGIIGVLLRTFSAPIGGVIMEDEVTAINREAAILTEQGIDIIIVLSHVGYTSDLSMAQRISSDVDIIVGAHSHTFLYTGTPPNGDSVGGEYPTVVTQANGHRIPVVQASCYTRYLGNIKLFIDSAGIVQRWEGQPVFLGTTIVQDPFILEELEPWRETVDAVGKEVLGSTIARMARGCYSAECILGSWACDGFLEERIPYANGSRWNDAHVCMINAGGIRNHIEPGVITTESLLLVMPFENFVQIYDLKGEYLMEALEFAVGVAQSGSFYSGRMLQIGGMQIVINATQPVGSRITSALVRCIDCDVPRYLPLDTSATYRVVTQNYIGDGGGGYTMLSDNRENMDVLEVDYVMLQRYMRRQQTVARDIDGRIQIVY